MSDEKVIRLSEVAGHKVVRGQEKSVWIAIHDSVYDVTKFLDEVRKETTVFCFFFKSAPVARIMLKMSVKTFF